MPLESEAKSDDYTSISVGFVGTGGSAEEAYLNAQKKLEDFCQTEKYDGFLNNGKGLAVRNGANYYVLCNAIFTKYTITRRVPVEVTTMIPFLVNQK